MPRLGWLVPLISLLVGTMNAQVPCDASRWGNVSGWKGQFSETGNGTGTSLSGGPGPQVCPTANYTNTQSITGAPVLQGNYSSWSGPSFSVSDVNIAATADCSIPNAGIATAQVSLMGGGPPVGGDLFELNIDETSCKYSLRPQNTVNDMITGTSCVNGTCMNFGPVTTTFTWGPIFGPGGANDIVTGLPANNSSGTGVIPLPAVGVDLSYTVPTYTDNFDPAVFAATWNANWKFSPKCQVTVPNQILQNAGTWGGDPYGGYPAKTIGALGCALTSLTMALQYAAVNAGLGILPLISNPGSLNGFMKDFNFFDERAVEWDKATRSVTGGILKFDALGGFTGSLDNPTLAKQKLDYALCSKNPHPVIVGVKITSSGGTNSPGHFVLVTGRDEDGHYTIVDPSGVGKTLDDYPDGFSTRGFVKDPPGDISALDIDTGDNITLLVTDAVGNQTGTSPTSGNPLQQIPGSAYFIDRVDDDITGEVDTHPAHMVLIPTPKPGTFTITAQGVNSGPYTITISGFSQDGSSQPPIVFNGNATPGSTTTYTINYVSTPGATSLVNFSTLAAKAEINRDGFEMRGSFTLGTGSAGISPDTQPVTLTLGSFTTTIPAGSFKRHHNGHYALEGTINGVHLEFGITPIGGNSFRFSVEAHDVNPSPVTSPLILKLAIGNDGGTTQVATEDE